MSNLVRAPALSLLERTRDLATLPEDELRRLAAEAARDRDAEALWALLEAHLTLHGSAGSRVSRHTRYCSKNHFQTRPRLCEG